MGLLAAAVESVWGETTPRRFTPPIVQGPPGPCGCGCALTRETSLGFAVVDFATDVLDSPPDPWQKFVLIHGLELLPDGRPRFRQLLVLVARQNGKSYLAVILAAFWIFMEEVALVLGMSTTLAYAKEAWMKMIHLVEHSDDLDDDHDEMWYRRQNGEQECWTRGGSRYKIAARGPQGGRSLTIDRLIMDELREHKDDSAWNAVIPAGNAVVDFQAWLLSNAGTLKSVVLNEYQDRAIDAIRDDPTTRYGLFEYSAPEDARADDPYALAMANPNMGHRIPQDVLVGDARNAMAKGGAALASFKTENMCIRVKVGDPALDYSAWMRNLYVGKIPDRLRRQVVMVFDVAPSEEHASLYAAVVLPGGEIRIDAVKSWDGPNCGLRAVKELPGLVGGMRIAPRAIGWYPVGPAAALAAGMVAKAKQPNQLPWPPPGSELVEIKTELPSVAMGFNTLLNGDMIIHSGDPLLTENVQHAERLKTTGERWTFSRKGQGDCDALYAAAGAVHLAQTGPQAPAPLRLVTDDDD